MNINLNIESYPDKIEVKKIATDGTMVEITSKGTTLVMEMDELAAQELMDEMCFSIKGFYIYDKINELEGDIDELKQQIRDMEEEKLNGNWEDVA